MKNYPFFITHEYEKFKDLYAVGQYTGAALELKDLFEIILKLPVLTGLAYILHSKNDAQIKACLTALLRKELSLGDWKALARVVTAGLPGRSSYAKALQDILESTLKLYDNPDIGIIKWRNNLFGHGAYVDDAFYKLQVDSKRPFLDAYLTENDAAYGHLAYYINGKPFCGAAAVNEDAAFEAMSEMSIEITSDDNASKRTFSVAPFIRHLFFFDSFNIHSMLAYGLNYLSGAKTTYASDYLVEKFNELIHRPENGTGVSAFQSTETETALNELNAIADLVGTKGFTPMDNLDTWFHQCLDEEKGVFLLQMARGMGKTGFVSHLDPLFEHSEEDDLFIRCYYCSRMEYRSAMDFANSIYQLWFIREEGGQLSVKDAHVHSLSNDSADPAGDMATLLEDILYFGEQEYNKEKVVLWIDGIDELKQEYMHRIQGPNVPLKKALSHRLLDFIPYPDDLPDNVYIFLTCRTDDETFPEGTKEWIRQFEFTDRKVVTRDDPEHLENLAAFIRQKAGKKTALTGKDIEDIVDRSEKNYLNIKLMLPAIRRGQEMQDYKGMTARTIVEDYLTALRMTCGKKQLRYMGHILAILAYAREPLSAGQISYLLEGQTAFRVEMIVALKHLTGLIRAERELSGERIRFSISSIAFKEVLKQRYGALHRDLVNEWIDNMLAVKEAAYFICRRDEDWENYNYVFNDGSLYLYSNILDYARETGNKKAFTRAFADCLMQYENHLSGKAHKAYGVTCDLAISGEVIHILSDLEAEGAEVDPMVLSVAYNNKVYHMAFTLYDYENALPDLEKSIRYLEMVPKEARDTRYLARSARICNNMANLLRWTGKPYETIADFRDRSGRARRQLMNEDFQDYAEDYMIYLVNKAEDSLYAERTEDLPAYQKESQAVYDRIVSEYADQCRQGILNPKSGSRQEYGYAYLHISMEMLCASAGSDGQEAATAVYRSAIKDLEQLMKSSRNIQLTVALSVVRAAYELSRIYADAGEGKQAEKILRDKFTWIQMIYQNNPDYLNTPVAAYLKMLLSYLQQSPKDAELAAQAGAILKKSKQS